MVDEITAVPEKDPQVVSDEADDTSVYDNMSDEEIMNISSPTAVSADPAQTEDDAALAEAVAADDAATAAETEEKKEEEEDLSVPKPAAAGEEAEATVGADPSKPEDPKDPDKPDSAQPAADPEPDYTDLYNRIMAPFKANGREVKLQSPEEAIKLMQQGANYTQKMQQLAPNLKLMRMLHNNGLLDEEKLTHLIDLDRKDPAAITKLLRDGKIDPLDLDVSKEPAYTPGNHSVSDAEMAFSEALSNVAMTTTGKETISTINSSWDQASKDALYKEPALLQIIDQQRANGIYDQIASEVERERLLGNLPGTSFIDAYKLVGDKLHNAGMLQPAGSTPVPQPQVEPAAAPASTPSAASAEPVVLDTRPAQPRTAPPNADKARRMAPPPRTGASTSATGLPDLYNMTDEQLMSITSLKV